MSKKLRIGFSFVLLFAFIYVALPKTYIRSILGQNKGIIAKPFNASEDYNISPNEDEDAAKFETPGYYTIFKFILDFIPFKQIDKVEPRSKHTSYVKLNAKKVLNLEVPAIFY